jgi:Uma2 family endonuclease
MATTARLLTAADLAALPDDGDQLELLRGEIVRMPPTKPRHGRITSRAVRLLGNHVEEDDLGLVFDNCGFLLARAPDVVLAPDVAFVRSGRLRDEDLDDYPALAPDLVIEVVSPSDTARDVQDKVLTYLAAGVRLVWVVEPRGRTVTVWAPDRTARIVGEDEILDGGDALPGLRIAVADLFR